VAACRALWGAGLVHFPCSCLRAVAKALCTPALIAGWRRRWCRQRQRQQEPHGGGRRERQQHGRHTPCRCGGRRAAPQPRGRPGPLHPAGRRRHSNGAACSQPRLCGPGHGRRRRPAAAARGYRGCRSRRARWGPPAGGGRGPGLGLQDARGRWRRRPCGRPRRRGRAAQCGHGRHDRRGSAAARAACSDRVGRVAGQRRRGRHDAAAATGDRLQPGRAGQRASAGRGQLRVPGPPRERRYGQRQRRQRLGRGAPCRLLGLACVPGGSGAGAGAGPRLARALERGQQAGGAGLGAGASHCR